MPAYKDSKTGTWFVKFYCKDWTGENKQIKKRGFATKREALDYERNYKIRQENNLDMTFGEFWKLYTEDVKIMSNSTHGLPKNTLWIQRYFHILRILR